MTAQEKQLEKHYWDSQNLVETLKSAIATNDEMVPGVNFVWDDYAAINSRLKEALQFAEAVYEVHKVNYERVRTA